MKLAFKTGFAVFLLVLMSFQGVSTFGISTFDTEVELNSSQRNFEIGLLNTGDRELNISFSAVNVSNGEVVFDTKNMVLPPSEVSGSPRGSGWYYLNGEYVETEYTEFTYIPQVTRGSESFNIEILAKPLDSNRQNYGPDIAQLREVSYTVEMPEPESGSSWSAGEFIEEDPGRVSQEDGSRENISGTPPGEEVSESSDGNVTDQETDESNSSVNSLTFLLLASTLITALYIYYGV